MAVSSARYMLKAATHNTSVYTQHSTFCSYTHWIHKLAVINELKSESYEPCKTKWNANRSNVDALRDDLCGWMNKYGLMSKKMHIAKIPQLCIYTAPYLSLTEMSAYAKLNSFLTAMDDLVFDNFNICNETKAIIVKNTIDGNDTDANISKEHNNLTQMYQHLLALPTLHNQTHLIHLIQKQIDFSLKEALVNSNKENITHYRHYLTDRGYASATYLVVRYLTRILNHNAETDEMDMNEIEQSLYCLCSDIIILLNDLIGFDREYQNGEICSYPLLMQYHDNLSGIEAQLKTYQLLLSKINEFKQQSEHVSVCNKLHFVLSSWLVGYYQHERNCDRQQVA